MTEWTCTNCGKPLEVEKATAIPRACPNCGANVPMRHVIASDTLSILAYERIDIKHRERGKVVREERVGDDFHRNSGKWNLIRRVVDHANNWYEKTIRHRDTGEITYHSAEPLDEHRPKQKSK